MASPNSTIKGQSHRIIKCAAGVGLQVDTTAYTFWFLITKVATSLFGSLLEQYCNIKSSLGLNVHSLSPCINIVTLPTDTQGNDDRRKEQTLHLLTTETS